MTRTTRIMLMAFSLNMSTAVIAAEPSPWLGSADQSPFQLDPATMLAITGSGDALQTGSLSQVACLPTGCITSPDPASNDTASGKAPQK